MADKNIGLLPAAPDVYDDSLLAVEQQGVAHKLTGAQFKQFARASVTVYVEEAKQYAKDAADGAESAASSADRAAQSAASAANSASTAQQYSGKPPMIQNGTWWIWNASAQRYEDTGEAVRGNVMYATFEIVPSTGMLVMTTPDEYAGPLFEIVNGYLEVSIGA